MPRDLLANTGRDLLPVTEPARRPIDYQKGALETALALGTGAAAEIPSGLAGLAGTILPGPEGQGADWTRAVQNSMTYRPRSESGQQVSEALAKPFQAVEQFADTTGEVTGDPSDTLGATMVKTSILAIPTLLGIRGLRGAKGGRRGANQATPGGKKPGADDAKPGDNMPGIIDTPDKKAHRLIAEALERDGLTPDEAIAKLEALGPQATLADLGENLAALARAVTAKPGPARSMAKDFLEERQAGQQMRLIRTTGLGNVKEFKQAFQRAMQGRQSAAKPLYEEAYNSPLDLSSPQMKSLLSRPSVQKAMKEAGRILKDEGGGSGHVRMMDAVKRSLDDRIGVAMRKGKRDEVRRLTMLKNEIISEVDRQVPSFGKARSIYAGEAAMRDAAQLGRNILTKKMDLDDAEVLLKSMGDGERSSFQAGALRGLVDKLESTANSRNAAEKLIESSRAREVMRLAFPDDAAFNRLMSAARAESNFSRTRNTVRGGSPTARIQQDVLGLETTAGIASQVFRGEMIGTAREVLKAFGVGKVSDKTLARVADLLFKRRPQPEAPDLLQLPHLRDTSE